MPKTSKKQQNASLDFSKSKTKLGRKSAPSNATSTAFKARSIALPQQGVSREREGERGTWKGKTVSDLLAGTRHYAPGVRKDSLLSLKELLLQSPSLQLSHASLLLSSLAPLISDADPGVRSTLHTFHSWYLLSLPAGVLAPHLGTQLLYTTSGMSHIYPDVRLDALRTLDVLLAAAPHAVAKGWDERDTGAARVMAGYHDLLGLNQTANSTVASDLSAPAKVRLLGSLRAFVEAASGDGEHSATKEEEILDCPTWFFRPAFASSSVFDAFDAAFTRSSAPSLGLDQTAPLLDASLASLGVSAWSGSDLQSSLNGLQSTLSPSLSSCKPTFSSLFTSLSPLLLSTFLDTAPSAFSPSLPISTSSGRNASAGAPPLPLPAELCCVLLALSLALWRAQGRSDARASIGETAPQAWKHLDALLGKIDAYFPFSSFSSSSSSSSSAGGSAPHPALAASDRRFAELAALHALHAPRRGRTSKSVAAQAARLRAVRTHIRGLLVNENALRYDWNSDAQAPPPPAAVGGTALEAKALVDLMPSLWLLLSRDDASSTTRGDEEEEEGADAVYEDLLELWRVSRGETKRLTTLFVAHVSFAHTFPSYLSTFVPPARALRRWIDMLPRYLWELGSKSPSSCFVVLEILRLYAVRCGTDELSALHPQLAPYFRLPARPESAKTPKGPYARLPSDIQRRAQGLLGFLQPLAPGLRSAAESVGAVQ